MARVVVVGGGFGGLSAAARLAKLRHEVTLLESSDRLGGRLLGHEAEGVVWQLDPDTVTLPGVFRDLFRKSGRPLERVIDLEPTGPRRHLFKDDVTLDLPFGSRAEQHDAVVAALGEDAWSPWVDSLDATWDVWRRTVLDRVGSADEKLPRAARRDLDLRRTVARLADKDLRDDRLRKIVLDPVRLDGDDRRVTPSVVALRHYVERTFGRWRFAGGLPALAAALTDRLDQRGVTVSLGETGVSLDLDADAVRGVVTDRRTLPADVVVWCSSTWPVDLPAPRLMPLIPAARVLLTLTPEAPDLPDEVVVHANPPLRLWSNGEHRWTVEHRSGEDPLDAMVRRGLDLRPFVESRVDLAPPEMVTLGHRGWAWQGAATLLERPRVGPPRGFFLAGSHAHPGATLEDIGSATAAIAEHLGPAPR